MSVKFPPELQFEPAPVNLGPRSPEPEYSGFIILRLDREEVAKLNRPPFSELTTLREIVAATHNDALSRLLAVIEARGGVPTRRLISGVTPERLVALEAKAAQSKFPPLNSLTAYFRLDVRQLPDAQAALVDDLNRFPLVEIAYRERVANSPSFPGNAGNLYLGLQRYLNAAPEGVGAFSTLGQPNGQGNGIRLVDLELDWNLNHEDLAALPSVLSANPLAGDRNGVPGDIDHGTAVLSIVAAVNNGIGGVGIAPGVASIGLASHFSTTLGSDGHVADAIATLLTNPAALSAGDVLLLEVQRGVLPAETDAADYDAIRLASASGIIVIEAAANGNQNLDGLLNPEDSGAIMVGASTASIIPPNISHSRYVGCGIGCGSNFGTRVDCYAWGEFILSASSLIPAPVPPYHTNFGGTSGAAAMIAGVALVVQGLYAASGPRLTNTDMRLLLSDPSHGTPSANPGDLIGVMPDLSRLSTTLNIRPIVLMRKIAGDMGEVPCAIKAGLSPDIIVSPKPVSKHAFPEHAGGRSYEFGCHVITGQDNYIYVRAQNLGNLPASRVTATVYLGEPSVLPNPQTWQKIGTTQPICLPENSGLVTLPPIIWQTDQRLRGYPLFAVIDSAESPAPPLPVEPETPLQDVQTFINYRNNVAANSVTSVEIATDSVTLPFVVTGASDCDRAFDLSILQRLPQSANVVWNIPETLFELLPEDVFCIGSQRDRTRTDWSVRKNKRVQLQLPPWRSLFLKDIQLPASAQYPTEFVIQGLDPETVAQRDYSLDMRQLTEGQEVGRLTWQLREPQPKPTQASLIVRRILRWVKWLDPAAH